MSNHFILDFETIGQDATTCPVIDCSYVVFDWNRFTSNDPYTFSALLDEIQTSKLNVKKQVKVHGFSYSKEDEDFWIKQPREVFEKILPKDTDIDINEFVDTLINYVSINKVYHWWSRSNTFDPIILWRLCKTVDKGNMMNAKLKYYAIRDIRTFIDAKFDFKTKNGFIPVANEEKWKSTFKEHVSSHDVAADILRLQAISRAENDQEMIEI